MGKQLVFSVFDIPQGRFSTTESRTDDRYIARCITDTKTGKKFKFSYGNAAGLRWGMHYANEAMKAGVK